MAAFLAGEGAPPGSPLVLVAHPEDALLGAWSVLSALPRCRVVHVTRGAGPAGPGCVALGVDPDAAARRVRREAEDGLARAGLARDRVACLGFDPLDLVRRLPELRDALAALLGGRAPTWVLTHAFEGGHPDHDATAVAAHLAAAALAGPDRRAPLLVEMAAAHLPPDGRPAEARFLAPFAAELAGAGAAPEIEVALGPLHRAAKAHALAALGAGRPGCPPLDAERFRLAPVYAFDRRPDPGPLLYERAGWGQADDLSRAAARLLARVAPPVEPGG